MDLTSALLFLTGSKQCKSSHLLLLGLGYAFVNHRKVLKDWYQFYMHKYMSRWSMKALEFSFTTCTFMDAQISLFSDGAYLKIDDVTRSVLWMFFRDPCKAKVQRTKQVFCQRQNSFMIDEEFSTTLDWPASDGHTYELTNGLIMRFSSKVQSCVAGSGDKDQMNMKQELATYSVEVMSMVLNHNQISQMIQDNLKMYKEWVRNIIKNKKFILYSVRNGPVGEISKSSPPAWDKFSLETSKTFSNMFFEHKELLMERLDSYMNDTAQYKSLGIPHTLGLLLHGEPGTGKTSVIKAIANHMNRHIININIKHFDSIDYLRLVFMDNNIITLEAGRNKRIYVFEEIDCAIEDMKNNPFLSRELVQQQQKKDTKKDTLSTDDIIKAVSEGKNTVKNIKPSSSITTGEMLELLDGVGETDDRVIIFTTNHPELLDKAFLRPGRIDLNLEFKKLRRVDMDDLYHLWFNKHIPKDTLNKMKDNTVSQAEMGKLCFTHKKHPERIIEELLKK